MCKCNAATHALLNSDTNSNLFLIQEPWFDTIGTARNDTAHQGVDVLGGVTSPGWEILYPAIPKGQRPKVMAYACKQAVNPLFDPPFTIVPCLDISSHPCLQVLDIIFDNETWRIINFYNDVQDKSCLQTLMSLEVDAVTPTLITGDFNTHSHTWSPPNVPRSSWAGKLEDWAAANLLTLANNPGKITRRGADHEHNSVIDLVWFNEAAVQKSTFSGLRVDWEGSLGSDHTLLHILGHTQEAAKQTTLNDQLGFIVDPEHKEEWLRAFKARSLPLILPLTPTTKEVEQAAAGFFDDIQSTNEEIFHRHCPFHPKAAPWWNTACVVAAQTLRTARGTAAHGMAQARLKGVVHVAK